MPMKLGLCQWMSGRAASSGGGGNVAPVITGVPTISGTTGLGDVLTASPASVTGTPSPTRTWQWVRDGVDIGGATASTYTLVGADYGATITVRQTETNVAGSANATSAGTAIAAFDPASLSPTAWFRANDQATMYQDNFGRTPITGTAQTVGLMLDISQDLALGSETVADGDFSAATAWTLIQTTTISGGTANLVSPNTAGDVLSQTISGLTTGRYYLVSYEITSRTSGSIKLIVRNGANTVTIIDDGNRSAVGTYSLIFAATGTSHPLRFQAGNTNSVLSIDNVTCRELQGYHAVQATAGSRPTLNEAGSPAVRYLTDDGGDSLSWSAPAGTYTVARVNSSGTVTIQTSQSLSGATDMLLDTETVEYIAVNRALTSDETVGLTGYLEGIANP